MRPIRLLLLACLVSALTAPPAGQAPLPLELIAIATKQATR